MNKIYDIIKMEEKEKNSNNQINKEELKNVLLSHIGEIVYIKYLNGGIEENTILYGEDKSFLKEEQRKNKEDIC